MTPELLKRAEELYFRVVDLPAPAREKFLCEACNSDAALLAEVRGLLQHHTSVGDYLEEPALGSGFAVQVPGDPDELIGAKAGRYRIESRLASGGMGTVYSAVRDDEFTQRVAIKVVKRGMDSEEILRRFRAERQTLAGLNHTNIARLIDGGALPDGRPFLVMELVEGSPIDEYCDRLNLAVDDRLRLFRTVCEAVRYAHQSLVVHRDLKPGNILVSEDGTPKLLDFGISRVLSGSGTAAVTTVQERRLTPEYASPEQALGAPVTTASDVYSLGVILFELLTGHRPYRFLTRTTAEFERVIAGLDPPLPSLVVGRTETRVALDGHADVTVTPESVSRTREGSPDRLRRRLRGDLDNIVLMAMRKDPQRRYSSVERLASDIDRYLQDLPIAARKDTAGYRFAKFVHRNKTVSVAVGTASLALAGGVAAVAWQWQEARRQRDQAFVARDQAEAISEFLQDVLRSADPSRRGPDATLREVLDEAAARVGSELQNQPRVQGAVRSSIGATYVGLGLYDQAEALLMQAYQDRLALLGPRHHDTAESMFDLAILRYNQRRLDEAEALLSDALSIFREIRGDDNLDVARVVSSLGAVLRAQGRTAEAADHHRRSLDMRRRLGGPDTLDVAESLNNLAAVLRAQEKLTEAEEACAEALRIRTALLGENHPLSVQSLSNLSVMIAAQRDFDRAEPLMRRVIELSAKALGPDHPDLAISESSLGTLLSYKGAWPEAATHLRRSLDLRVKAFGESDHRTLKTRIALAKACRAAGQFEEAERALSPALAGVTDANVPPEIRADAFSEAATLYEQRGQKERADEYRALLKQGQ